MPSSYPRWVESWKGSAERIVAMSVAAPTFSIEHYYKIPPVTCSLHPVIAYSQLRDVQQQEYHYKQGDCFNDADNNYIISKAFARFSKSVARRRGGLALKHS